ncbi:MAG: ferric-dicitrate binding protein FerR (iron transport regulator) [Saprospiraceae bacterium]|jgi:ferric-dicitrate binding protein FerR (iron transport regulator)
MKEHIDKIIKSSETEKHLDIRPELWNRLERQLDNSDSMERSIARKQRPKRRKIVGSKWLAAASLAIILTIISTIYIQLNSYHMEDLNTSTAEPYFTKEDLSGLENFYNQPDRLLLHKKPV